MAGIHPRHVAAPILIVLTLMAVPAVAQPWIPDWDHRISFDAVPAQIEGAGTFTDITLLLSLDANQASVFAGAKADGSDLVITTDDGTTQLDREIVHFDPVAMSAEIWFRVPTLSQAQNGFFLYYGNAAATWAGSATDAWNSNYRAIYHFDDDPGAGTLSDSSPAAAHATLNPARMWTSGDVTAAPIHQGWAFNGSTHHISTNLISTQSGNYAIGAWLEHTVPGTDFFCQTSPGFWHVSSKNTSNGADFAAGQGAVGWDPRPLPLNEWHHFAWVFDADNDTILFYYDGVSQVLLGTFPPDLNPIYTGEPMNPTNSFPVGVVGPMGFIVPDLMDGAADEFRVHEGVLSPEWLKTEFNNQLDAQAFYTFGSEETQGPTSVPVGAASTLFLRSHPNPFAGATSIEFRLNRPGPVRLVVYDVAGREVAQVVHGELGEGSHHRTWNGRTADGTAAASGVYFLKLVTPQGTRATKLLLMR